MSEEMPVHSPTISAESAIGPAGISRITRREETETGHRRHGADARRKQNLTAGSKLFLGITTPFV